jgi:hypothetical protein
MTRADRVGHPFDGVHIADVADFDLRTPEVVRKRAQTILPSRDEDAPPTARRERARDRGSETARRARDNGDAVRYLQTRITRVADRRLPCLSVASALRR